MTKNNGQPSWLNYSSYAFTFLVRLAVIALVAVLAIVVIRGLNQEGYRVRPFQMPKHLSDAGYTGSVSAIMLQNKVLELKEIASSIRSDSTSLSLDNRPDLNLDLMGVGLSTGSIIYHMRDLMGRDNDVIDGSITLLDDVMTLHLWMTGQGEYSHEVKIVDGQVKAAMDELVTKGAMRVLGNTDPYRLAILHYRQKDMDSAQEVIRQIIEERPADRKWAYNLWGNLSDDIGKRDQSIKYYKRAIEIDPNFELPRRLLGWQQVRKKQYDEALVNFEKSIELSGKYLPAYNGAAVCHRELGNYDKADEYYHLATEKFPDVIWTYGNYADFLITTRQDTIAAANVWKDAGEHLDQTADYYISSSAFYIMSGDTATAMEYAQSALELDPDNPNTINAFAQYFESIEEHDIAADYMRQLIGIYNEGEYDKSMRSSAYNSLSIMEYSQGKLDSAYAHVMTAIDIHPENPFPWTTLAEIRILQKNKKGFYSALQKAIDLGLPYRPFLREWPYNLMLKDRKYQNLLDSLEEESKLKG